MKRTIHLLTFLVVCGIAFAQGTPKYVFYFIGDGMGVNQVNGTEMYLAELQGRIGVEELCFTQFPVATTARTFSATNTITDSSAGGTAIACGVKSYNGAIGVDVNKQPVTSVAEQAKRSGFKVGITTSVSVDHATPAAFYAHQLDRNMYYEIARDLPRADFDFYAGSGFLRPNRSHDHKDTLDIFPIIEEAGYTIARGYQDFKAKEKEAQKMVLIQEKGADINALPYAIDQKEGDLTLAEITESAISFLTKDNKKGFFLMVEGGKIDWACHANDGATAFHEVVDMDNAVKVAYEFYKKHPKETLIVITADHETGGLGLGRRGYQLNLKALQYQKVSQDKLSDAISNLRKEKENQTTWEDVKQLLGEKMGFFKEIKLSWEQERKLRDEYQESFVRHKVVYAQSEYSRSEPMASKAKEIINEIAQVGWTTGDHSAGLVPVFAIGAGSQFFQGQIMDNTEIPKRIAKAAKYK